MAKKNITSVKHRIHRGEVKETTDKMYVYIKGGPFEGKKTSFSKSVLKSMNTKRVFRAGLKRLRERAYA
jgi:hypothetical protein